MYNYKVDLLKGKFYSEKVLEIHIQLDIIQQEREIIERCSELISKLPQKKEIEYPSYIKIREIFKQIKLKERNTEEKTQDELIHEFGLN